MAVAMIPATIWQPMGEGAITVTPQWVTIDMRTTQQMSGLACPCGRSVPREDYPRRPHWG
ncbi:hypothetical protein [Umezawaea sp. Da 62-37]|uniref:hypothetical protein n=1 Tax=Umezawaea sp. Da 62-37 TaxID=3075927 RepID=UPI0028F6D57F|nr:hypothetical protein [Umezawaea sp. Da 62-37]WNV87438.1 hypothetical protein RM788_03810 [Umezawaea sp. Da 62-37]